VEKILLFGILIMTYGMLMAKRMPALVRNFRMQSFFLFLFTLLVASRDASVQLYIVAALIFVLKVTAIPYFLLRIGQKIKVNEDLGLFINPQLSIILGLVLTYLAGMFSRFVFPAQILSDGVALTVAFSVVMLGLVLMIFRMRAFTQIVGLLVMENGLFLLASFISGGMPFFVEIAIFFDVFVSVVILGLFVYRINRLFTHIDINKLARLRG
jgi:hydrogenase-4 component E